MDQTNQPQAQKQPQVAPQAASGVSKPSGAAPTSQPASKTQISQISGSQPKKPVVIEPEPASSQPEIVQPQPKVAQPQPKVVQPKPVVARPESAMTQPKPVVTQPKPAAYRPKPAASQPKPSVAQSGPSVPTVPKPSTSKKTESLTPAWREGSPPDKKDKKKLKISLPNIKWDSKKTRYVLAGFLGIIILYLILYVLLINPYSAPQRIRVTNITDRSATVSWVTSRPTKGVVIFAEAEFALPGFLSGIGAGRAYDDRDVSSARLEEAEEVSDDESASISREEIEDVKVSKKGKFYVHHVTVSGLDPETTYYFRVGNGFMFSGSEEAFSEDVFTAVTEPSFRTFQELEVPTMPDPTYGSVVSGEEMIVDGVMFMSPGLGKSVSPLSGILNDEGGWYIDLSAARDPNGEIVTDFSEESDKELLMIEGGMYGKSDEIIVPMSDDTPVRDIDLSEEGVE